MGDKSMINKMLITMTIW